MQTSTYENLTPAEQKTLLQVENACKRAHFAWKTQQTYTGQILSYLRWLRRNEIRLAGLSSERKIELFLAKRVVHDHVTPATRDQAFYALLFLYGTVLKRDLGPIRQIARSKRQTHLPVLLDMEQVLAVLSAIEDSPATPFRLIACLLYGCGLRVSEGLRLRIKDVSLSESRLVLRDTKSRRDRNVGLPSSLLKPVARQIERVRSLWEVDQANGLPVSLPGMDGLRRKYPSISKSWGWYYLFPQHRPCLNPQALAADRDTLYRHHQGHWGIQRAVKEAAAKCQLEGVLTPHALRHAFATHLDARGEQLTTLQALLGHKDVRTTMVYVHRHVTRVESPLDHTLKHAQGLLAPVPPPLALPFPMA